jgi:hypothetical protein
MEWVLISEGGQTAAAGHIFRLLAQRSMQQKTIDFFIFILF